LSLAGGVRTIIKVQDFIMLKKLIITSALMSAPGLAFAADLPVRGQMALKAPALQEQPFSWTGFYIGANVGDAFDNSDRVNAVVGGLGAFDLRNKSDGVTAGGQFGYNYEFRLGGLNGIVVGVEADAAYTDLSGSLAIPTGIAGATVNLNSRLDYLGTIRGRLGYAYDRLLIYGTGGFAYGTVEHSADLNGANFANLKTTETGFTYGGGFEYALPIDTYTHMSSSSAVTVGAEYLRYELDSNSASFALPGLDASIKLKDVGNIVRARINYKF
jgi:outer membrane immunogenic protein